MKNKKITIISIMLLCFVTIGCSKQKQTFYKNQLNIISDRLCNSINQYDEWNKSILYV